MGSVKIAYSILLTYSATVRYENRILKDEIKRLELRLFRQYPKERNLKIKNKIILKQAKIWKERYMELKKLIARGITVVDNKDKEKLDFLNEWIEKNKVKEKQ